MLELRQISKTFNPDTINEVRSLREVSLSIEDGSFVTVIGTNGSGKSTLLNAVAGTFFVERWDLPSVAAGTTRPEPARHRLGDRPLCPTEPPTNSGAAQHAAPR